MASTYVNDLRLNEMATGDQSGSWGTVTNTNLELIGEAFSYGTEAITTNADTHTTTIADGASDPGRAMFLKYTGSLDSACTITIGPNTVSKMWFIENATSGSQNIIISQGSGANVTIAAGQTKAVYSDGAGAGAAFVDAFAALSVAGVSPTELGVLDGITASTAELNYNDIATLGLVEASKVVTADSNSNVIWEDNKKAAFGNAGDLEIYHDASASYISETGTGSLNITSDNAVYINKGLTEIMAAFNVDSGVDLYYDNAVKLATTSGGITVTGEINGGDLRGDAWAIGRDNNDYINVDPTQIDFVLDAAVDMRLYNNGDLHVEGNVIAYSTTISDERLKTDIVKIDSALDKVDQINGYTFTYTADGKKSAGVIAQEVEKVLPSAITESTLPLKMGEDDKTEYKTVQYDQLIGLLVEAVKELKAEVAELKGQ